MEPLRLNPLAVQKLTFHFKLKFLGVKTFDKDLTDALVCVDSVKMWWYLRKKNKPRVMLTVSPYGMALAEDSDGVWTPMFHHSMEEITFVYHTQLATRLFAYTVRPKVTEDGAVSRIMCIGMKVKRFSGTSVDDIHHAYEAAFQYMRACQTENMHRVLHGIVTSLQQVTISTHTSVQHQMNGYSGEAGVQVAQSAMPQASNGKMCNCKGKHLTKQRPPEGAEGGSGQAVFVCAPRCSRPQCSKCTDGTFCRHCACTSCRRGRYQHRSQLEAQATRTSTTQHHGGGPRRHSDPRPLDRLSRANSEGLPSPETPANSLRNGPRPSRDEIHHMAQQVAIAVLKDKEQREEMNPESLDKLVPTEAQI